MLEVLSIFSGRVDGINCVMFVTFTLVVILSIILINKCVVYFCSLSYIMDKEYDKYVKDTVYTEWKIIQIKMETNGMGLLVSKRAQSIFQ